VTFRSETTPALPQTSVPFGAFRTRARENLMTRSKLLGLLVALLPLGGCVNLNIGLAARDAPTCASCDAEVQRAEYLEQIRRSGFAATRDEALMTPGQVRSTELK
jgi:hypothetical protein